MCSRIRSIFGNAVVPIRIDMRIGANRKSVFFGFCKPVNKDVIHNGVFCPCRRLIAIGIHKKCERRLRFGGGQGEIDVVDRIQIQFFIAAAKKDIKEKQSVRHIAAKSGKIQRNGI